MKNEIEEQESFDRKFWAVLIFAIVASLFAARYDKQTEQRIRENAKQAAIAGMPMFKNPYHDGYGSIWVDSYMEQMTNPARFKTK